MIVVVAAVMLMTSGPSDERSDMGTVTASGAGLTGHLFVKWDKQLQYRLAVEPSDPEQKAGFGLAVASSPHPLSIGIQLKDNQGFVLCSSDILLKYDARSAMAMTAPDASVESAAESNASGASGATDQQAQVIDYSKVDAQEAAREKGNDLFQNQMGTDGQPAAINAQGQFPCSKKAFANIASWSLVPTFPSLAEQNDLLKRQKELQALAAHPPSVAKAEPKKTFPVKLLSFSTEGDDVIVDLDLYHGVIETRGRKTFYFDKTNQAAADLRWQEYPVIIHYKCDRSSECELMHSGLGMLHTRMRR
jgi:hypothetical protein